ncbi:MAG TPA: hypothetical protein VHB72_00615 [Candidatus Saccharimonadales bacterium]|nr:hypothetical protein [Candidatus Saccharimonadales bacterium]
MSSTAEVVPFDGQLPAGTDIPKLWETGRSYGQLSPRRHMRLAGRLLVRAHTRDRFNAGTQEELESQLDDAQRHFSQLRRFGMSIVTHETVISPQPWPEDNFDWDDEDIVAFSASAYITHLRPLKNPDSRDFKPLKAIPRDKVSEFVLEPLWKYLQWAAAAKESTILEDIYTPDQYGWQQSSNIVALHDPGPQMHPIGEVQEEAKEVLEFDFFDVGF